MQLQVNTSPAPLTQGQDILDRALLLLKAKHIKRAVSMAIRGFERIETLWDENALPEPRAESLAAATLDKHDAIIRRNLGMNETQGGSGTLNLDVLVAGGRRIVSAQKPAA